MSYLTDFRHIGPCEICNERRDLNDMLVCRPCWHEVEKIRAEWPKDIIVDVNRLIRLVKERKENPKKPNHT